MGKQSRHEKIIDFLSGFTQYQTSDKKPQLQKVKKSLSSREASKINVSSINNAVVAFTDVLNIEGGSIGDIDLYELMQIYLLYPKRRAEINSLVGKIRKEEFETGKLAKNLKKS